MILIFIGLPGSGKGTQASIISKKYEFVHLSTGDLIRKEISDKSQLGLEIKNIVETGGYVADNTMLDLVDKYISSGKNYILDGFPRTLNQANKLNIIAEKYSNKIVGVFKFDIDDKLIIERVSNRFSCAQCGQIYNKNLAKPNINNTCTMCRGTEFIFRTDDDIDKLKDRIKNYYKFSQSIEHFYKDRKMLFTISANNLTNEVSAEIESFMKQKNLLSHKDENL